MTEEFIAPPVRRPRATLTLIALNVVIYVLVEWLRDHSRLSIDELFALSQKGLMHGRVWQIVTFQFLHAPLSYPMGWQTLTHLDIPWHLLLNCWGIYVFGPPVEYTIGRRNFVALYLVGGILGGLLQILAGVLSHRFGGPVVGASAGLFALIAAFTTLYPETRLTVLLFLIIPVRMTANTMLTLAALISVAGLIVNGLWPNLAINRIAHAAHLGGLIAGLVFLRWKMRALFTR